MEDEILIKGQGGEFEVVGVSPVVSKKAVVNNSTASNFDLAEKVAKELKIDLSDDVLDRRFKNIVLAQAKDIRTDLQTADALTKGVDVGGLGFDKALAQQVISLVKKEAGHIVKPNMVNQPVVIKTKELPKVEEPKKTEQPKREESIHRFSQNELDHELAPPPPVVKEKTPLPAKREVEPTKSWQGLGALVNKKGAPQKIETLEKKEPQQSFVKAIELAKPAGEKETFKPEKKIVRKQEKPYISKPLPPQPIKKDLVLPKKVGLLDKLKTRFSHRSKIRLGILPNQPVSNEENKKPAPRVIMAQDRSRVTDIKAPSRLTGPIEELQNFKIADLRKLNSDPVQAILRIKGKIDLLEKQSFSKKIEGIDAWRASEVHRVYLSLGRESIEAGSSLAAVIKSRQQKNQPFLTKEEFLALGKLNKMLEY